MASPLMLVFPSRGTMIDALDKLRSLDYVDVKNTALVAKAEDGETVVYEDDISVVEGSITGGTLGSMMAALGIAQLGAFLLPGIGPIIAIGAGALIGGLVGGTAGGVTAGLIDFGFKNDQLEALAEQLQNGRIAMVIEIDGVGNGLPRLREDMQPYNVEFIVPSSN